MLVELACALMGMALGMALMLFISWITYLRREKISLMKHLKDIYCAIFDCLPDYRNQ